MSQLKYCQGPECHEHKTKDRIRGSKGDKHYETRKRSSFYYGKGNFCDQRCLYDWCDMRCQSDWFELHGQRAVDHFGRLREPKRKDASNAWYKDYVWRGNGNDLHFFVNDLLGERRPITQQQYHDENLTTPS